MVSHGQVVAHNRIVVRLHINVYYISILLCILNSYLIFKIFEKTSIFRKKSIVRNQRPLPQKVLFFVAKLESTACFSFLKPEKVPVIININFEDILHFQEKGDLIFLFSSRYLTQFSHPKQLT